MKRNIALSLRTAATLFMTYLDQSPQLYLVLERQTGTKWLSEGLHLELEAFVSGDVAGLWTSLR